MGQPGTAAMTSPSQHVTLTGTNDGNAGSGNLSAMAGADGLTLEHVTYSVTTTAGGTTTFIFG